MGLTEAQQRYCEKHRGTCTLKAGVLRRHGRRICEHAREHRFCKDCGGSSICEHGRERKNCTKCVGSSICQHGRRRRVCFICRPSGAVAAYKAGAKTRGYAWELTDTQAKWLMQQPCAYCGEELAGGIDRAKNEYGYTPLNSVPCCKTCNRTKLKLAVKAFIVAVNAAARYCPDYQKFKRRWEKIRNKLTQLGEQNAALQLDVPRVRKTRGKVADLEGGTGSAVVPLVRVPDGSDTRCASVV
jgi:hypothetical protein